MTSRSDAPAPQQGPADTEEAKRARLPNVVGHYAKAIRRMNERGDWPVDSDFAIILERAAIALRSQPAASRDAVLEEAKGRLLAYKEDYSIAVKRAAALEGALKDIADGPQPIEGYKHGIRCGLEDRDLQRSDAYTAAEYGYEKALEWCADIAIRDLKSADPQVDKVVAASTAAGELAPAESAPSAQRRVVVPRESHRLVYNKATKRIERVSNVTGLVADSFEPPSECSIAHEHRYERDGERPGE